LKLRASGRDRLCGRATPAESSLVDVDDHHGVPCVIYAAKSTEDRKGTIQDQVREVTTTVFLTTKEDSDDQGRVHDPAS
jgi:hypothetical protein